MISSKINKSWSTDFSNINIDWFHERIEDRELLLITVGDSWTWGDSLGNINWKNGTFDDYEYRTTNIYGYHLSNKLNSDWVNIGLPGSDNLFIIWQAYKFMQGIDKKYKNIHVVITLTESGRDLSNLEYIPLQYNQCKGVDWPDFNEAINNLDNFKEILNNKDKEKDWDFLIYWLDFYQNINNSKSIDDFFVNYESFLFKLIKKLFKSYTVGRNFTYTCQENKNILENNLLEKIWVDIIKEKGNLSEYTKNLYVVSQNGLDPLIDFLGDAVTKNQLINLIQLSLESIKWLESSPYNSKIGSKHPLEQAHIWWADYLYEHLKRNLLYEI
jgi:hypothetical protein